MLLRNADDLKPLVYPDKRMLGLDLGEKTIGVSVCDTTHTIATPLLTITRKNFKSDLALLTGLIKEHAAAALVIGYPVNMNGTEGPRCQGTRQFAKNIVHKLPIPILLWDERMSSLAVGHAMSEANLSRQRRADVVDKMAAGYILQGVLDYWKAKDEH